MNNKITLAPRENGFIYRHSKKVTNCKQNKYFWFHFLCIVIDVTPLVDNYSLSNFLFCYLNAQERSLYLRNASTV